MACGAHRGVDANQRPCFELALHKGQRGGDKWCGSLVAGTEADQEEHECSARRDENHDGVFFFQLAAICDMGDLRARVRACAGQGGRAFVRILGIRGKRGAHSARWCAAAGGRAALSGAGVQGEGAARASGEWPGGSGPHLIRRWQSRVEVLAVAVAL